MAMRTKIITITTTTTGTVADTIRINCEWVSAEGLGISGMQPEGGMEVSVTDERVVIGREAVVVDGKVVTRVGLVFCLEESATGVCLAVLLDWGEVL